ncbi:microtubule-associated protein futsch-like [Euwallacea fornicatus]|uniref:microtubule-associated protein futsch-like n=1 Tax=Euwallacea fornicatus TaxID=995702 RepID=UPI00338D4463
MEAVNGGSLGEGGAPPPSPLTGCYLLVVVGEPHSQEHKDIILQKIAKGLLSWDVKECLVDLEKELTIITEQRLEGEEARFGERLIQFASENLVTEILIHPAVSTLSQCVRNLLSSFTRHRHIIHAGYTFQGNGSWALQDGTFSYSDFAEAFQEIEVQRVIHAYENGISIDLHCAPEGEWTRLSKESFAKSCKVRVNPTDVLTTGSPSISGFSKYLEPFLVPTLLEDILESSDVVGNIRFSRPTLYVFPGGQGDASLFGINGFNMLLDGGYSRKACFWDFVRHLDRLDAVLMTRLNNSSVCGVSSVLKRKRQGAVYPQIGHFFCNIQERKSLLSPDGDKDKDPLIISLLEEGQNLIQDLKHLNLSCQPCYRDSEPIILYHKVGHGTLNMFVLSPDRNSKEVREFLLKWNQSDAKLLSMNKPGKDFIFPLQNSVSICALLVWQPANPNDTVTRILYPGSAPQRKIFEGLDRLKSVEYMKHPTCTVKTFISSKKTKQEVLEKLAVKEKKENKVEEAKKGSEMNGDVVRAKRIEDVADFKPKTKPDNKPKVKEEVVQKKKIAPEKKGPATPKKTLIENKKNGDIKEKEKRLTQKPSPDATPAKSAKDASNRKVIENKRAPQKKEQISPPKPTSEAKPKPERKPISRRPKTAKSPVKKPSQNSTQKPDSLFKKGKLDKEGTTDSSTVSTPSADQDSILKKDISKLTPEEIQQLKEQELEELKEEQEVNKEIEAVFRKSAAEESEPGVRQVKESSIDLETEEYLIVEKEEHSELENKEDEIQKLARDSEESEKQRKSSEDEKKTKKPTITSPEGTDKKEEEIKVESQPDEKVESGATTTAPTLPEDERMTLDEIKEDKAIEEKHVKEETKEKEVAATPPLKHQQEDLQPKQTTLAAIPLDKQRHMKDAVKTPDEVADLPMHEEADYQGDFQAEDKNKKEAIDEEKVLEKAETETKEKADQDNNLIAETIIDDDEWVMITNKSPPKEGLDLVKTQTEEAIIDQINEKLKHDKEVEVNEHEVRLQDEIQVSLEEEVKEDIKALIEEADLKDKIVSIKESKQEMSALDDKLSELKKDVKIPIGDSIPIRKVEDKLEDASVAELKENLKDVSKIDDKLSELKSSKEDFEIEHANRSPQHAEAVILSDYSPEEDGPKIFPDLDIDKAELGRKSPAEREEDVKKIVVSVAEVLKSDAPLEELQGKPFGFAVELKETHITTQDSPIIEAKIIKTEDEIPPIPEESEDEKQAKQEDVVHRMLVTASSEDGGEETEICPAGSITFSRSSESSGRSSPEQKTQSQKSSVVETEESVSTARRVDSQTNIESVKENNDEKHLGDIKDDGDVVGASEKSEGKVDEIKKHKSDTKLEEELVGKDSKVTESENKSEEIEHIEKSAANFDGTEELIQEKSEGKNVEHKHDHKDSEVKKVEDDVIKTDEIHKVLVTKELGSEVQNIIEKTVIVPVVDATSIQAENSKESCFQLPQIDARIEETHTNGISESISSVLTNVEHKLEDTLEYIEEKAAGLVESFSHARKDSIQKDAEDQKASKYDDEDKEPLQRRQSIIEKAEELIEKSEAAFEGVITSIGQKAHSLLEEVTHQEADLSEKKTETSELLGSEKRSSIVELSQNLTESLQPNENTYEGRNREDLSKEPSEAHHSTIEKAELSEKSKEAFGGVIASVDQQAHSLLEGVIHQKSDLTNVEEQKKKETCEPLGLEKKSSIVPQELQETKEDIEEKSAPKESLQEHSEIKKPEDVAKESPQRRQSIIEKAEELIKSSEEAFESVVASIGQKTHSLLETVTHQEPDLKSIEENKKETTESQGTEKRSSIVSQDLKEDKEDIEGISTRKQSLSEQSETKESEHLVQECTEKQQSIIEKAKDLDEKPEEMLEGVITSIGQKTYSLLHSIEPEEKKKVEDKSKETSEWLGSEKHVIESSSDLKKPLESKSEHTTTSVIKTSSEKDSEEKKFSKPEEQTQELPQRRLSIIEKAEELVEKSEEAFEGVMASISQKAHSLFDNFIGHEADMEEQKKKEVSAPLASGTSITEVLGDISEPAVDSRDLIKEKVTAGDISTTKHSEDTHKELSQEKKSSKPEDPTKLLESTSDAHEFVTEKIKSVVDLPSSKGSKDTQKHDSEDTQPPKPQDEVKDLPQRRESIIEKAEELIEKSETAFEGIITSIGQKSHSLLEGLNNKEPVLMKSEEDIKKETSECLDAGQNKIENLEKSLKVEETEEKPKHIGDSSFENDSERTQKEQIEDKKPSKQEDVQKEIKEGPKTLVKKAEDLVEKSEEAFEEVITSINGKAQSLLDGLNNKEPNLKKAEENTTKETSELQSALQIIEEKAVDGKGQDTEHQNRSKIEETPNDLLERRESIIEKAEELIEKSEEALEGVITSIGQKTHSLLEESKDNKIKESDLKKGQEDTKKETPESLISEKGSGTIEASQNLGITEVLKDQKVASQKDLSLSEALEKVEKPTETEHLDRKSSVVEAAEEFIETSEQNLDSVFSAIGGAVMTVLQDILPKEQKKSDLDLNKDVEKVLKNDSAEKKEVLTDIKSNDSKFQTEDSDKGKIKHEETKDSATLDTSANSSQKSILPEDKSLADNATKKEEIKAITIDKDQKDIEDTAKELKRSVEDLSKLTDTVVFDEFKLEKKDLEKEERKLEDGAEHLRKSYEDLSKLNESISFDKCQPSDEFKFDRKVLEQEEKQMVEEADTLRKNYEDLSKLSSSVSFDKCQNVDDYKFDKEILQKEERQMEEEAEHLRRSYEDLSKLAEEVPFKKCSSPDQYKFDKETLKNEERQMEDEAIVLRRSYEDLTKLTESISFDKCKGYDEFQLNKETLKKEERQIEDETLAIKRNVEDLSKISEEVKFEKCKEEYKFDKDDLEKEERQMEDEADALRRSYENLSKLVNSTSFDKCKVSDEFKLKDDVREREERQMEEEADALRRSYEDLSKLAESTSFDKCKMPDEFKLTEEVKEREERQMEEEIDALRRSHEDPSQLATSTTFDKCKPSDEFKLKEDVKQKEETCLTKETVNDSELDNEVLKREEHQIEKESEVLKRNYEEVNKHVESVPFDKCNIREDFKLDEATLKKEEKQLEQEADSLKKNYEHLYKFTESVSFDKCKDIEKLEDKTEEKGEKESAEKTLKDQLKVDRSGEPKKLSVSDVEICIKTDSDHRAASQSFLENERGLICDSTDAKICVPPSGDGSSALTIGTSSGIGASSDKSSPEPDISGKTTPPTVPISPIAKEGQLSSTKRDSGLIEQETDDEDLSTKSQVANSQSDLDELDMKSLDPMSTSLYGALPKEFDEPPTYLYEITKAKYTSDVKFEDDLEITDEFEVTAARLTRDPKDGPSFSAVDSWGKPLGLPGPKEDIMTSSFIGDQLPTQDPMTTSVYFDESSDPIASWGKPLGLPSPAPPNNNGTPKKEKKLPSHVSAKNKLNDDKRRSESPSKLKARKMSPVYVDLTYVPHHGNHYYSSVDFFKRIRARYYVFSGLEPSRQLYDALLEAKQTWEDKDLEVTIIPTYDTDILGYWVAENEDLLAKHKIDLAPSASRCTINLQDHETSCSAYRLEF